MSDDLDERLDRACADGKMSTGDADVIREFAAFLSHPGARTGADPEDRRGAIAEHHDLVFGDRPHPAACPGDHSDEEPVEGCPDCGLDTVTDDEDTGGTLCVACGWRGDPA